MLHDHRHYCLGVTGISGSGKSSYLARFLRSRRSTATARFIFDPKGGLISRLGVPRATTAAQLMAQLETGWCAFYPFPMFRTLEPAAAWFCGFVMTAAAALPGRKFAVFDELQSYAERERLPEILTDIWNTGRNHGIDPVYVTQSFGEVSRSIVKHTTEAVAFNTACSRNEWWLRRWGFDVSRVRSLPRGSYLSRDLERSVGVEGRLF
jgi:hypothetical protein